MIHSYPVQWPTLILNAAKALRQKSGHGHETMKTMQTMNEEEIQEYVQAEYEGGKGALTWY